LRFNNFHFFTSKCYGYIIYQNAPKALTFANIFLINLFALKTLDLKWRAKYNKYEKYDKSYKQRRRKMAKIQSEESKDKYLFGVCKVGERGQIVIPKEARDAFDIKPGDSLLLFGNLKKGLALVKTEVFSDIYEGTMKDD
jgi:AbrB family looped-hinge helix DNA binding protein